MTTSARKSGSKQQSGIVSPFPLDGRLGVAQVSVELPEAASRGLLEHFRRFHALTMQSEIRAPGRSLTNCHVSSAYIGGWLAGRPFDFNLIGAGGLYMEPCETFPELPREQWNDLIPGQVYGIVDRRDPRRLIHTFSAVALSDFTVGPLDKPENHAVRAILDSGVAGGWTYSDSGWGRPPVLATAAFLVDHVYKIRWDAARVVHVDAVPKVLGTDAWERRNVLISGGDADGRRAMRNNQALLEAYREFLSADEDTPEEVPPSGVDMHWNARALVDQLCNPRRSFPGVEY